MQKRLILTERDEKILHDLYENTVMSFSQIMRRHFPGKSLATIANRLSRLQKAGFLTKTRVGIMLYVGNPHEVGVVYQVGTQGLKHLRTRYAAKSFTNGARFNPTTLSHDLLLNDCIEKLEDRFLGTVIVNGKHLNGERGNGKRRPDAMILGTDGKPNVAIELELNAKSETRYRHIVLQYSLDSTFEKVLYIVAGNVISDKIKFQITHQKEIKGLSKPTTGKFYFTSLEEILKRPTTVSISNGSGELFVN